MGRIYTVLSDPRIFYSYNTPMSTFYAIKDPSAVLDYYMDWTSWLGSDAIGTSTWISTSTDIVVTTGTAHGTATTTMWLTGGVEGEVYDIRNHIVTTGGRTDERTIQFTIVER